MSSPLEGLFEITVFMSNSGLVDVHESGSIAYEDGIFLINDYKTGKMIIYPKDMIRKMELKKVNLTFLGRVQQ